MTILQPKKKHTEEIRVLVSPDRRERMQAIKDQTGLPFSEQARRGIDLFLEAAAEELERSDEELETA